MKYDGMVTTAPYSPPISPKSIIAVNALLSDICLASDNTNSILFILFIYLFGCTSTFFTVR